MAKEERKTFKYGDQEYYLDDLLNMHAQQELNYYNFAKSKGQYNDEALAGLRNAIASRISAIKSGESLDGDGTMGTDQVDNTRIETRKKGLFKKAKYVDQDNTEWAKYYVNKLVEQLKPTSKKVDRSNWDISKYGLEAYLNGQGLDAKEIFENLDKRDENNPDQSRSSNERRELLKKHLPGYYNWLTSKNFNFTDNDNDWDDDFVNGFKSLMDNFDNLSDQDLTAALRKAGAGDKYVTAFTSDRWDLSKSNAETEAERKAAKEKQNQEKQDKAWLGEKQRRWNIYQTGNPRKGQISKYIGVDRNFEVTDADLDDYLESVGISKGSDSEKKYWDYLDKQYAENPYNADVAAVILPLKARAGRLGTISNGDYAGWMYDPDTIDEQRQSALAINSTTGEMQEIFIGNLTDQWKRIKNKYMTDNGFQDPIAGFQKDGGVLEFQTGGAFSSYEIANNYKTEKNKERADAMGRTEEVQEARDRVVSTGDSPLSSADPTLAQPDAGFSGAEMTRLASIAVDIGSLILDPVSGAVAGGISSLMNFGADIADDGFQWGDVGNLGINLGFDLLGMVPAFGDIVGTGGKITKTLIKFVPRLMAGMAAFQGVSNFDGMMTSLGKLTSGDEDQKMTVQDWRNIAQCIGLVTGTTRAVKAKVAQNSMKKAAKVDDVVGIDVYNKRTQETKQILVDGDTANKIREAKGDKTQVEKVLSELEMFKDKFGDAGDLTVTTGKGSWQKPWEKVTNADGSTKWSLRGLRGEGRAKVNDVYDFSRISPDFRPVWGLGPAKARKAHLDMAKWMNQGYPTTNARGAKTSAEIDIEVKKLQDEALAEAKNVKTSQEARTKRAGEVKQEIEVNKNRLNAIRQRLGTAVETDVQAQKTSLEARVKSQEQRIADLTTQLEQAKAQHESLKGKKVPKKNKAQHDADIIAARNRVRGLTMQLGSANKQLQTTTSSLNDANRLLADFKDLGSVQANVNRLQDIERRVVYNPNSNNGTNAYARLQTLISRNRTNNSNIGGRQVDWDIKEILRQAGVTKPYKEGGSINKAKLNKFLNYGKG